MEGSLSNGMKESLPSSTAQWATAILASVSFTLAGFALNEVWNGNRERGVIESRVDRAEMDIARNAADARILIRELSETNRQLATISARLEVLVGEGR